MIHIICLMNNILYITSLLLCIPLIIHTPLSIEEYILCFFLLINTILSIIFWIDSRKGTHWHEWDATMARISLCLFTIYALFVKNNTIREKCLFSVVLLHALSLFWFGSLFSKEDWLCFEHQVCHAGFHYNIMLGCFIAL